LLGNFHRKLSFFALFKATFPLLPLTILCRPEPFHPTSGNAGRSGAQWASRPNFFCLGRISYIHCSTLRVMQIILPLSSDLIMCSCNLQVLIISERGKSVPGGPPAFMTAFRRIRPVTCPGADADGLTADQQQLRNIEIQRN